MALRLVARRTVLVRSSGRKFVTLSSSTHNRRAPGFHRHQFSAFSTDSKDWEDKTGESNPDLEAQLSKFQEMVQSDETEGIDLDETLKELGDDDMSNLFSKKTLTRQARGQKDLKQLFVADSNFGDLYEFDDIISRENPPKLDHKHYQLLKGIYTKDRFTVKPGDAPDALRSESVRGAIDTDKMLDDLLEGQEGDPDDMGSDSEETGELPDDSPIRTIPMPESNKRYLETVSQPSIVDEFTPGDLANLADLDTQRDWAAPNVKKHKCYFCEPDFSHNQEKKIHFTNIHLLHKFLNYRGMITSRRVNHNCGKHQRKLARQIKRARWLGLLSFTTNWKPAPPPDSFEAPVYEQIQDK